MRIHECPFCKGQINIKKVGCTECGVNFEGEIYTSPLFCLSEEHQRFIELFITNSGSLKKMAHILGVTYPTVRLKLNHIINQIQTETRSREKKKGGKNPSNESV